MDKEEILAKSRKEKKDEGMSAAENRGRYVGIEIFSIVFIFILVFNLINGQSSYAPMAMFFAFLAAEAIPKYKFTKKKTYLIIAIMGGVATFAYLGSHVITTLR